MTTTTITVTADVPTTPRLLQISGMFDYTPADGKQTSSWTHTLPLEERPWKVGLIVGPSGSGKTLLARELWPDLIADHPSWSADSALIDVFDQAHSIHDITGILTAVGLGSVPAWVRPYSTLSNGEQFRADMARTIIDHPDLAVVDEFTSVVDRQVAKIAAHAIQKTIRRRDGSQFVAVTCHYDVEDWLQPDWVYDVAAGVFTWRQVQSRPPLNLHIHETSRAIWPMFERHHYLSASLNRSAKCFAAYTENGNPVAFTSYIHFMHPNTSNIKMGHRLVVLPDWQGLGIAKQLEDWLGERLSGQGFRYRNVVAHPGMIKLYSSSPRWQRTGKRRSGATCGKNSSMISANTSTRKLAVYSFEYRPRKEN